MTKQDFGPDYTEWQKWWSDNGDDFLKGKAGKKSRRFNQETKKYANYSYYNITTYSKCFVFVLDCSGSMMGEILPAKSYGYGLSRIARIKLAKQELIKLIENLTEDTAFNIVHFANYPVKWKDGLEMASKRGKKEAVEFVERITCMERGENVLTNLYDAMNTVFDMATPALTKKRYSSAADTIFLLSDGVPYGPNWLTDREAIVHACKEQNRHLKIRIHTISLAGDMETPRFLSRISSPNGGEMKDVLKN